MAGGGLHTQRRKPIGRPFGEASLAAPALLGGIGGVAVPVYVQLGSARLGSFARRMRFLAQPADHAAVIRADHGAVDHFIAFDDLAACALLVS
jgi:hypothetical protein